MFGSIKKTEVMQVVYSGQVNSHYLLTKVLKKDHYLTILKKCNECIELTVNRCTTACFYSIKKIILLTWNSDLKVRTSNWQLFWKSPTYDTI